MRKPVNTIKVGDTYNQWGPRKSALVLQWVSPHLKLNGKAGYGFYLIADLKFSDRMRSQAQNRERIDESALALAFF